MGREKLTDARGVSTCSLSFPSFGGAFFVAGGDAGVRGALSKLMPRPPDCFGGGDDILCGGSKLEALCRPDGVRSTPCGRAGTGGAFAGCLGTLSLPGDGDRSWRSVNDVRLSSPGRGLPVADEPLESRL